jgi:hypothetical protein
MALNDDVSRGIMTGDDQSSSGTRGITRAVLFDPSGQMITRHGLARPDKGNGDPGTYPRAYGDWNFTTKTGDMHMGVSSPGVFIVDMTDYAAQGFSAGRENDAARVDWIRRHASVVAVNANTGGILR